MGDINKIDFGGRTLIDLTSDTVTEDTLLSGTTAHDATGKVINGQYTKPKIKMAYTVKITKNGSRTILTPDGYAGMATVNVTVNVPTTPKTASGSMSATLVRGTNTLTLGTVDFTPTAGGWHFSETSSSSTVTSVKTPQGNDYSTTSLNYTAFWITTELSGNTIVGEISVASSGDINGTVTWWAVG